MKSIVIKNSYGLDNVSTEEQPIPTIQSNEVLVKIKSISLNQLDLMIAKGALGTKLPHVLGSDAVGVVEKTVNSISKFKVGDVVSTHFIQSWQSGNLQASNLLNRLGTDVPGVFSEYIALSEDSLVKIPANLTTEEASTLPIAGLTAWEALFNVGGLKEKQTVLLQGTGGVSIFALQFAKSIGAKVIIISSSDEKIEKAKLLGADEAINYKTNPDWPKKVLELTKGAGVDLALEMSWAEIGKTTTVMRFGGKIAVVGLLGGANVNLSVFDINQKNLSIIGVQVGSKASFEEMNKRIETHDIKPVVDKFFPLSELSEALDYFDKGKHFGKVVLTF
ncbi:NAD(P)-dependent alcohol dehydrogenase [Marivirga sp. S37H4]|uniref:NAD(P)-dependent alcohol dehydrogenase n=1 Tax=Marivirga aurantiaca TaxID=2802615 RepID=A0A935CDQ5_9BACT|nr:NAD(P)-dependent alcohol dehydrogenase [Marivirga aurantiaca]MBK6267163.1 NAD(P)-dependent alcohol dehydrogenase [Marivirga aurantiaca]